MSISELSEQEQIRRNSLAELRKLGIEPYPAAKYEVTATAARIAAEYDPDKGNFQEVSIAGRIMSRRIMGSASFFELQDHTGRIQVYVKRDDICNGDPESTLYNKVFKKLLDIGDIVGIRGFAFITKTGVGALQRTHGTEQIVAPAAGRQRKGRAGIRRLQRSGTALPPTLCRPDRQSAGTRSIPQTQQDRQHDARVF